MSSPLSDVPKVELHVHLDGSFDAELLFAAARRGLAANQLPKIHAEPIAACGDDLAAFKRLVTCLPEERSLKAMLDKFMLFLPIVQGDLELIEALAHRFVKQQAEQNIIYTEVRYSPHILTSAASFEFDESTGERKPGASARDDDEAKAVVDAVTRGLRRGCAEHPGTEVAQILCFIDGKPQWTDALTELAAAERQATASSLAETPEKALPMCPVVAVDVAAGEAHFADASGANGAAHRKAMCRCRELGLGLTNHAGESGPAANVAVASQAPYGAATRIGHGYAAVIEGLQCAKAAKPPSAAGEAVTAAEMVDVLRAMGIADGLTMECCPTSSKATGGVPEGPWTEHPAATLSQLFADAEAAGDAAAAAALPRMTISSDDPAVFASSLTEELAIAVDKMGLSHAALRRAMFNAVDGSFLPPAARVRLRRRLEEAWPVAASS